MNEKNNTPAKETIEIDDENSSVTSEDSMQIIHPSKLRKISADTKICSTTKSNKINVFEKYCRVDFMVYCSAAQCLWGY